MLGYLVLTYDISLRIITIVLLKSFQTFSWLNSFGMHIATNNYAGTAEIVLSIEFTRNSDFYRGQKKLKLFGWARRFAAIIAIKHLKTTSEPPVRKNTYNRVF